MSAIVLIVLVALVSGAYAQGPLRCPRGECLNICGRICEPTCANPKPNPLTCPRIECTYRTEDCRCIRGLLRNPQGRCVRPRNCCQYCL